MCSLPLLLTTDQERRNERCTWEYDLEEEEEASKMMITGGVLKRERPETVLISFAMCNKMRRNNAHTYALLILFYWWDDVWNGNKRSNTIKLTQETVWSRARKFEPCKAIRTALMNGLLENRLHSCTFETTQMKTRRFMMMTTTWAATTFPNRFISRRIPRYLTRNGHMRFILRDRMQIDMSANRKEHKMATRSAATENGLQVVGR